MLETRNNVSRNGLSVASRCFLGKGAGKAGLRRRRCLEHATGVVLGVCRATSHARTCAWRCARANGPATAVVRLPGAIAAAQSSAPRRLGSADHGIISFWATRRRASTNLSNAHDEEDKDQGSTRSGDSKHDGGSEKAGQQTPKERALRGKGVEVCSSLRPEPELHELKGTVNFEMRIGTQALRDLSGCRSERRSKGDLQTLAQSLRIDDDGRWNNNGKAKPLCAVQSVVVITMQRNTENCNKQKGRDTKPGGEREKRTKHRVSRLEQLVHGI